MCRLCWCKISPRALNELKERGFLLVGLDEEARSNSRDAALRAPLALVLGAEGKGLRQLTRETCDLVARLTCPARSRASTSPTPPRVALHIATTRIANPRRPTANHRDRSG